MISFSLFACGSLANLDRPQLADDKASEGGVAVWSRHTLAFSAPSCAAQPDEVQFEVAFTDGSTTVVMPGFHAGHTDEYRVEFMPPNPGTWSWNSCSNNSSCSSAITDGTLTCPELDEVASSGDTQIEAIPPAMLQTGEVHPGRWLAEGRKWRWSDTGDYFVPLGLQAEIMWEQEADTTAGPVFDSSEAEFEASVAYLASMGFNHFNTRLTDEERFYQSDRWNYIFTGDWADHDLDEDYWDRLQRRLDIMATYGVGVVIVPFVDNVSSGLWCGLTNDTSDGNCVSDSGGSTEELFIRHLVARTAAFPNVMYDLAVDYEDVRTVADAEAYVDRVQLVDPYRHPVSVRHKNETSGITPEVPAQTFDSDGAEITPGFDGLLATVVREELPVLFNDSWWEESHSCINSSRWGSPDQARRGAWKLVALGGPGAIFRGSDGDCGPGGVCDSQRSELYFWLETNDAGESCLEEAQFFDADTMPGVASINPLVAELGAAFGTMYPEDTDLNPIHITPGDANEHALFDPGNPTRILVYSSGQENGPNASFDDSCSSCGGDVELDLTDSVFDSTAIYTSTWINPRTGHRITGAEVIGGTLTSLTPPSDPLDDWALLLESDSVDTGEPGDTGAEPDCASIELGSPADGALLDTPPTFAWSHTCEAVRLELSVDPAFRTAETFYFGSFSKDSFSLGSRWSALDGMFSAGGHWRIVGQARDGTTTTSETRSFTVSDTGVPPAATTTGCSVSLDEPVDDAVLDATSPPMFRWSTDCDGAVVELSSDGSFDVFGTIRFGQFGRNELRPDPMIWASLAASHFGSGGHWRVMGGDLDGDHPSPSRRFDFGTADTGSDTGSDTEASREAARLIEVGSGTWNVADVVTEAGTSDEWAWYRPAVPGSVVIEGGGDIELSYVILDGFVFDARLDPDLADAISKGQGVDIRSNHVRIENSTFVGVNDIHNGYNALNQLDCHEAESATNGHGVGVYANDAVLYNVIVYGFRDAVTISTGDLTVEHSFFRNNFNGPQLEGDSLSVRDSCFWDHPNHQFAIKTTEPGSFFELHNTVLSNSQDMIKAGASWDGADKLLVTHNTFFMPQNDPCGEYSGINSELVREEIVIRDNLLMNLRNGLVMADDTTLPFTDSDYNLLYQLDPIVSESAPDEAPDEFRWNENKTSWETWTAETGLDQHSVLRQQPLFVDEPVYDSTLPDPGSSDNAWGWRIPQTLDECRSWLELTDASPGKGAASDGHDMGIDRDL